MGTEPVAMTMSSHFSTCSPPFDFTLTVFLSFSVAVPITTVTLWLLSRMPTPPVSLPTMPAFHSTSFATSRRTSLNVMPIAAASCARLMSAPAAIIAFDGMQPTLRHVPPRYSFSTTVAS
jgi:hypothetical protein